MPGRTFVLSVVFLTALIDSIGFGVILPVTPLLFMEISGDGLAGSAIYGIERFEWIPREVGYSLGFIGILMVFVQCCLIRIAIPKLGLRWAGMLGLSFDLIAFLGYAGATTALMVYIAMLPGALGALAGPALNGIASSQVGADQQGELQAAMGSMMSLTFSTFSGSNAPVYFPGAPFLLAAVLTVMSRALFMRVTATYRPAGFSTDAA